MARCWCPEKGGLLDSKKSLPGAASCKTYRCRDLGLPSSMYGKKRKPEKQKTLR